MCTSLRLRGSFVCLGLLLAVGASAQAPHGVWVNAAQRTITVEAEGSASSQAEVMYVLFGVEDTGPLASVILQRNLEHVHGIVASLKALGPPVSQVAAAAPEFGEADEEGRFSVSSDLLVTLDVSEASKLDAARGLVPKMMDAAARCRGVPKLALEEGG